MPRIIDSLKPPVEKLPAWHEKLKTFELAMIVTLTWAPDREYSSEFKTHISELRKGFSEADELVLELKEHFFSHMYVERDEEAELKFLVSADRLILVFGLMGVGKSVLLRKIKKDFDSEGKRQFAYIDLKEVRLPMPEDPREGASVVDDYLYGILSERYAYTSDTKSEWILFDYKENPAYREFREILFRQYENLGSDSPLDDWKRILNNPEVLKMRNKLPVRHSLQTLLRFLRLKSHVILCLDNIDSFSIPTQRVFLSKSIHMSNQAHIPIVLTIRSSNLKRIDSAGMMGDPVLFDRIEAVKEGPDQDLSIQKVSNVTIKSVLRRRIEFFRNSSAYHTLKEFFREAQSDVSLSEKEYEIRFWKIFDFLADTFFEEGIIMLCNYNLRAILNLYCKFINKIILHPEAEYSLMNLITTDRVGSKTRLRTYLYKWIVANGDVMPSSIPKPPCNYITKNENSPLSFLHLRILEYIWNWYKRYATSKLTFRAISQVFFRFGLEERELMSALLELRAPNDNIELGHVYLDIDEQDEVIRENTIIELLPAGEYFLQRLSISREFAFWCATYIDTNSHFGTRPVLFDDIYSDKAKLDIVHDYVEEYLLNAVTKELDRFSQTMVTPRNLTGGARAYYERHFAIAKKFYPCRVLESVRSTIPFSDFISESDVKNAGGQFLTESQRRRLNSERRAHWLHKYDKLIERASKLVPIQHP